MELSINPQPNDDPKLIRSVQEIFNRYVEKVGPLQIKSLFKNFISNSINEFSSNEIAITYGSNLTMLYNCLASKLDITENVIEQCDHQGKTYKIASDILNQIDRFDHQMTHLQQKDYLKKAADNIIYYINTHQTTKEANWDNIKDASLSDINNILAQKSIFLAYDLQLDNDPDNIKYYRKNVEIFTKYLIIFALAKS
ncbi:MAG TPA: hypothetical protein PLH65_01015 [bacterium]|nr:hypothetical protein [bacterium]